MFEVRELATATEVRCARFRFREGFVRRDELPRPAPGGCVVDEPRFEVRAAILEHHGPCLGFLLAEREQLNVRPERVEARGLAIGPWLTTLKRAIRDDADDEAPIALSDGRLLPLGDLRDIVFRSRGQRLGYITDVRDTPDNRAMIATLCADADVLYIEASFEAGDTDRAHDRAHLTTTAAGEIARAAGAKRVEPFHFSPRNALPEAALMDQVRAAFNAGRPGPPCRDSSSSDPPPPAS